MNQTCSSSSTATVDSIQSTGASIFARRINSRHFFKNSFPTYRALKNHTSPFVYRGDAIFMLKKMGEVQQLDDFMVKMFHGFPKPQNKFIRDIVYGIQATGDTIITDIARDRPRDDLLHRRVARTRREKGRPRRAHRAHAPEIRRTSASDSQRSSEEAGCPASEEARGCKRRRDLRTQPAVLSRQGRLNEVCCLR